MRTMVKKPKERAIPILYPCDDPFMVALDLIVEYGKFYKEWKEKRAAEKGERKQPSSASN
jgi:hypothetical protein